MDVDVDVDDVRLVLTCGACPEQYDAYLGDGPLLIGYLRLRHGYFTVHYPDPHGELIYEGSPFGDGAFEPGERDEYLAAAKQAIVAKLTDHEEGG